MFTVHSATSPSYRHVPLEYGRLSITDTSFCPKDTKLHSTALPLTSLAETQTCLFGQFDRNLIDMSLQAPYWGTGGKENRPCLLAFLSPYSNQGAFSVLWVSTFSRPNINSNQYDSRWTEEQSGLSNMTSSAHWFHLIWGFFRAGSDCFGSAECFPVCGRTTFVPESIVSGKKNQKQFASRNGSTCNRNFAQTAVRKRENI